MNSPWRINSCLFRQTKLGTPPRRKYIITVQNNTGHDSRMVIRDKNNTMAATIPDGETWNPFGNYYTLMDTPIVYGEVIFSGDIDTFASSFHRDISQDGYEYWDLVLTKDGLSIGNMDYSESNTFHYQTAIDDTEVGLPLNVMQNTLNPWPKA